MWWVVLATAVMVTVTLGLGRLHRRSRRLTVPQLEVSELVAAAREVSAGFGRLEQQADELRRRLGLR